MYNPEKDWLKGKLVFQPSKFETIKRFENPKDQKIKMYHKRRTKIQIFFIIGARIFMTAIKKETMFVIYEIIVQRSTYLLV